METWKLLIILFAASAALGLLTGVIAGKIMLKREKSGGKPLLSKKERVVYAASILLGIAFILLGVFYPLPGGEEASEFDVQAQLFSGEPDSENQFA